mmetsp:Transcript_60094/g.174002  ORF Transcript_60094/g.174002 Transcript_60094/m.174002 type:complete len:356 (+) Transcript_60094:422-1489(+)
MTMEPASGLPCKNSPWARASAFAVQVVLMCQSASFLTSSTVAPGSKCLTHSVLSVELKTNKPTLMSAAGSAVKDSTSFTVSSLDIAQPWLPKLPLLSSTMTTSNFEAQFNFVRFGGSKVEQSKVLHGSNIIRTSSSSPGHSPLPSAGVAMLLVRPRLPPPQAWLHVDQGLQSARTQSASQAWPLQTSSSSVSSQASPPCCISTRTLRERSRTPPPHSAEQEDQPPHASRTQSMGHGCMLHSSSMDRGGQAMPPSGGTITSRDFLRTPPPQVDEHSNSLQSLTSQSVMKRVTPSNLYNSPRIFSRAQISERSLFCSSQHFVNVSVYSALRSACCRPLAWDCASESIWFFVHVAKFV